MKKVQYDRFEMALRIENYLNENAELFAHNVPMLDTAQELIAKIAQFKTQLGLQLHKHTGITLNKKDILKDLEAQAFVMAAGCCSYALAKGNKEFYKHCHYSKTALLQFRDLELEGNCLILLGNVVDHASELIPYNITPAMIDNFQTAIDNFREITNKPSDAIAHKAEATAQIKMLLPEIMDLIRIRLATDMVSMAASHPHFVSGFKNLSHMGKTEVHKRSLTVIVKDADTGEPLAKAAIETDKNIRRKTGAKGMSFVAKLPEGRYKLGVSHPGYQYQSLKYTVVHGLATKVEVLLYKTIVDVVNPITVDTETESVVEETVIEG